MVEATEASQRCKQGPATLRQCRHLNMSWERPPFGSMMFFSPGQASEALGGRSCEALIFVSGVNGCGGERFGENSRTWRRWLLRLADGLVPFGPEP
jgi:hypothetical protein